METQVQELALVKQDRSNQTNSIVKVQLHQTNEGMSLIEEIKILIRKLWN